MDYDTDGDISDTCSENMDWIDDELMEDEFYNAFYNSPIESIQIVQMLLMINLKNVIIFRSRVIN